MGGFSGTLANESIFPIVVNRGQFLDEITANQIFSIAAKLDLEFQSTHN
jgi:hypothetical protein